METGDFTTAEKAFEQALSIARARRDTRLELRTLTDSLVVYMWNLNMRKTHETASRILELCRTLDDPQAEALARLMAWWYAANATGDTDKARVHMSSALALAERLGDRHLICSVLFMNAQLARWQGDWATARQNTDRALALDSLEVRILHVRVQVESEVGDFEAADVYLERVVEFMHLQADAPYADGYGAVFIAYSEGTTGRSERRHIAEAAARRAVAAQFTERIVVLFASWALALIAIQRGDPAEAGKQYAALEGFGEGFREYRGSGSDRTLGLLACTMGQLDRAAAHFEDALAFCRKAGYRPELAWTCCDYADTLLKRNAAGDSRKATQLLDEALAISRELGMRPLMERVLSRRKLLKA
jgi:tetratricopeptide (TPR) repeat protein